MKNIAPALDTARASFACMKKRGRQFCLCEKKKRGVLKSLETPCVKTSLSFGIGRHEFKSQKFEI